MQPCRLTINNNSTMSTAAPMEIHAPASVASVRSLRGLRGGVRGGVGTDRLRSQQTVFQKTSTAGCNGVL
eukprot:350747-Chlamydomonas_euryale.AAC.2